jgi:hypothetical protein
VFLKTVPAIILAFIVGGLVGYALSTSQALTAAAAVADAVPIPDADQLQIDAQLEITASTPIPHCPPSKDIVNNAGVPPAQTEISTTPPATTEATGSPVETPIKGSTATDPSCVPPPCELLTTAEPTAPTMERFDGEGIGPAIEQLTTERVGAE